MDPSPVVLFVDRDPSWSRPLRADLRRRGARVVTVASEPELYRLLPGPPPDACVLDASMVDAEGGPMEPLVMEVFPRSALIRAAAAGAAALERRRVASALDELLLGRLKGPARPRPVVLCVDDDPLYLNALARLLGRHGYSVAAYEDPERALEAVPELDPDLAVVDIRMPGMSGLDLTAELRAKGRPVPVLVLSALGTDADVLRAHRRGAEDYLTKPCDPRRILEAVGYLVGDVEPRSR